MAIIITDECINCGACEAECPNTAIYEGASEWKMSEGTKVVGPFITYNSKSIQADENQDPLYDDIYFIVPDKCTECIGFYDEPQCAAVCPVDCCVPDDEIVETHESLKSKKIVLHSD